MRDGASAGVWGAADGGHSQLFHYADGLVVFWAGTGDDAVEAKGLEAAETSLLCLHQTIRAHHANPLRQLRPRTLLFKTEVAAPRSSFP